MARWLVAKFPGGEMTGYRYEGGTSASILDPCKNRS